MFPWTKPQCRNPPQNWGASSDPPNLCEPAILVLLVSDEPSVELHGTRVSQCTMRMRGAASFIETTRQDSEKIPDVAGNLLQQLPFAVGGAGIRQLGCQSSPRSVPSIAGGRIWQEPPERRPKCAGTRDPNEPPAPRTYGDEAK